jgi:hypothetical protein
MKKFRLILSLCFFCGVILGFTACPMYQTTKPDSELFGNFEPLEWNDDYIFAATDYPPEIQVWNSSSGKLVRVYSLKNGERSMWPTAMAVHNKNIWFVGDGMQRNFLRLNVPTGELTFLSLDCKPESVITVEDGENGEGTVWAATYSAQGVGFAARQIADDGTVIRKCNVSADDIAIGNIDGVQYVNGRYLMFASKNDDFSASETQQTGYKLVNLSSTTGTYITELDYGTVFPEGFLSSHMPSVPSEFVSAFYILPSQSDMGHIFAVANVVDSSICARFLFTVTSWDPVQVAYTGIVYNEDDARSIFSVSENSTSVFVTGRVLYDSNFNGLETGTYPAAGGDQQQRVRMPYGNQLYCAVKDGKSWFCRDINIQDPDTLKWDTSGQPEIYMLDHATGITYKYSADGTRVQLQPETD